jgi:rSAM/selenodomain-associated transferase 1
VLPLIACMMNVRSRLTAIATGDQAMFVTRGVFEAIGGFPALPLMEDVALSATLKRVAGAPACLRAPVVTSGRRWDDNGVAATVATMWRLRFDHWRGVDAGTLAARYRRTRSSAPPTLVVFAKDPVPGQVKTRLAAAIGDGDAASVYRELAERTLDTACAARAAGIVGRVELWCDPDAARPAFVEWRERYGVDGYAQRGADLGARMRDALGHVLKNGVPALLIGTDCPALDTDYLARAASALATHDAVLGPAADGGYVLVGAARDVDLFSAIPWSTPRVMAETHARIAALGVTALELPPLWDVDTADDLARYRGA